MSELNSYVRGCLEAGIDLQYSTSSGYEYLRLTIGQGMLQMIMKRMKPSYTYCS